MTNVDKTNTSPALNGWFKRNEQKAFDAEVIDAVPRKLVEEYERHLEQQMTLSKTSPSSVAEMHRRRTEQK